MITKVAWVCGFRERLNVARPRSGVLLDGCQAALPCSAPDRRYARPNAGCAALPNATEQVPECRIAACRKLDAVNVLLPGLADEVFQRAGREHAND